MKRPTKWTPHGEASTPPPPLPAPGNGVIPPCRPRTPTTLRSLRSTRSSTNTDMRHFINGGESSLTQRAQTPRARPGAESGKTRRENTSEQQIWESAVGWWRGTVWTVFSQRIGKWILCLKVHGKYIAACSDDVLGFRSCVTRVRRGSSH